MSEKKAYLGIDPGRDKTGAALVLEDGTLVRQAILPTQGFFDALEDFLAGIQPAACIMGNGTTSEAMRQQVKAHFPQLPLVVIDEYNSTQEAKELYKELHPAKGLGRLVPRALRSTPSARDGLAAAVLVKRYLCGKTVSSS